MNLAIFYKSTYSGVAGTHIIDLLSEHKSYLCENIYHVESVVTVYQAKNCLPWFLLNKQKKCVSLSEVSKTLGIDKKSRPFQLKDVFI